MRKKHVILLSILGVVTLAGLWGYQYFFNREVSTQEINVTEDFFDFSAAISLDEKETAPSANKTSPTKATNGAPVQDTQSNQTVSTSPAPASSASNKQSVSTVAAPISEESIKNKYYPRFEKLQSLANSRLDQLVNNARSEYNQRKKNGNTSVTDLASKYTSAANKLQGAVDQAFYQLLAQMKSELSQAGMAMNLADQAEQAYQAKTQQKKAEIMRKASKVL